MTEPPRSARPHLLRRLLQLSSITAPEAAELETRFGVLTLADLHLALAERRLRPALGDDAETRLRRAAAGLDAEARPLTLGRAWDLLDTTLASLAAAFPALQNLTPAGDVRRAEPLVGSLVIAASAADPAAALDAITAAPGLDRVLHRSTRRALLLVHDNEVDVRIAPPEEFGTVLFRATGDPAHVAAIHRRRGLPRIAAREEEVYAYAGLQPIAAELRHATGEIEAAAAGRLPRLVERADIRGDLHMHSTYSDGRDALDVMVRESSALGYEYIAITDHSETSAATRSVTLDQLARQRDEVARLRDQYPRLVILHGIEVEILPDGRLDFADAVLERLDIVLASLHDPAKQDGRALTRRCLQAIRHPLVNVITHPENRLVGRREGYDLDFESVHAAAVESGTALEIDGAPSHLDLDGEHARAAVAAGVTVTIDSDSHRAGALDRQMRLGIGTARRGWVEPRHVLNTRPIAEIRAFVAAKRGRRIAS